MALVLGIVGNARHDGYTVKVVDEMLRGAASVEGVEARRVDLLRYDIRPCRSCYECIRMPEHRCVLADDMGRRGSGALWQQIEPANGLILGAPVHCWSADALTHLFVERLYPFLWSGELKGIPLASTAVASNQGFQTVANTQLCEWSFVTGARYIGGLPVHVAYWEEAMRSAYELGERLGTAAREDATNGRRPMTDEEIWLAYESAPWSVLDAYAASLTRGTGDPALSLIRYALAQGTFQRPEAIGYLRQADAAFEEYSRHRALGRREEAIRALVRASALWTHATWSEFLEEQLIKAPPPAAYRPLGAS